VLKVTPNPASARAFIRYQLPYPGPVACAIYDVAGKTVAHLFRGRQPAGRNELNWDARNVKPGIYFCKLITTTESFTALLLRVR
jgi:hypothetical protein